MRLRVVKNDNPFFSHEHFIVILAINYKFKFLINQNITQL